MKNKTVIATFLTVAVLGLASTMAADRSSLNASVITSLTSMPLAFTENQGQWDEQVLFRANAGGATMWLTKDGAYYQFTRRKSETDDLGAAPLAVGATRVKGNLFPTQMDPPGQRIRWLEHSRFPGKDST